MEEIEEEAIKGVSRCEKCGSVLVRNGQEVKKVKTLIGMVEVNRVRLRCQGCQGDIYPLDQAIGLGPGGADDTWSQGEEFMGDSGG